MTARLRVLAVDTTGERHHLAVTTDGGPGRARELAENHLLDAARRRPQTILVCIPGGKK